MWGDCDGIACCCVKWLVRIARWCCVGIVVAEACAVRKKRHLLCETPTLPPASLAGLGAALPRERIVPQAGNVVVRKKDDVPSGAAVLIDDLLPIVRSHNPSPATFRYVVKELRRRCGLATPVRPLRFPRALTPAEVFSVTEIARSRFSPRHLVLAHLLFATGLRVSEVQKLDVRDIDFVQHQILVREGKGRKDRVVMVSPKVLDHLRLFLDGSRSGPLFSSQKRPGRCVSTRQLQRMYSELCVAAGLGPLHPHTARHTFAMLCRARGMALQDIQALMGHSSVKTTEIYARMAITPELRERYLLLFG